jgi:hypothetical protein
MFLVGIVRGSMSDSSCRFGARANVEQILAALFLEDGGIDSPYLFLGLWETFEEADVWRCIGLDSVQEPGCEGERCGGGDLSKFWSQNNVELWVDVPGWSVEVDVAKHVVVNELARCGQRHN